MGQTALAEAYLTIRLTALPFSTCRSQSRKDLFPADETAFDNELIPIWRRLPVPAGRGCATAPQIWLREELLKRLAGMQI